MEFSSIPGLNPEEGGPLLLGMAMKGEWGEAVDKLTENPFFVLAGVPRTNDTLLHLAVYEGKEKTVRKIINIINEQPNPKMSVRPRNYQGNTSLHLAAMTGNVAMCKCIASVDYSLIGERNYEGETPLFTAVFFGQKQAFKCLYDLCLSDGERYSYSRKSRTGDTILHSAISEDHFDLALLIIELYGKVMATAVNEEGITPLHLLAEKPWAFPSGSLLLLGFGKTIIYHCILVDEHEVEQNVHRSIEGKAGPDHYPENYKTCIDFFLIFRDLVKFVHAMIRDKVREPRDEERPKRQLEDPELSTRNGAFYKIFKLANRTIVIVLIALGIPTIGKIYEEKRQHKVSIVIMKKLLTSSKDEMYTHYCGGKMPFEEKPDKLTSTGTNPDILDPNYQIGSDKMDTEEILGPYHDHDLDLHIEDDNRKGKKEPDRPILIATRNGISEIVEKILELFPTAIHDTSADKNVMLLAVQNKQPHVFQILQQKSKLVRDSMLRMVDNSGNNVAHLAAELEEYRPWLIPGEALQMQWEMKWFEFVKQSIPSNLLTRCNNIGKTPEKLFFETHKKLVKDGGEWLIKTSESYTLVAALIATVAFATSTAVPGGVKEDIGIPTLQNRTPFHLFAISSLIALCFSVTALVTFLSILTSRYKARDFAKDLPMKLLMGLTSLFFSIAAMLISFCSGHLFVIDDKLKYVAYTVYAATCVPVTLFALMQFPLYFDLIHSTFSKVPRRSYMASIH